ncbi:MAG: 30S ribosome-binding factor RbfA [Acidimicrobiia bacterium]|nr:30S ribosome-binding factor RbfA [Acidimicrobiia bacterium]
MTTPRMLKVNSTLREVLADEVERLSDSRLEMVSITGVDTAPNLRRATVYVDVLAEDGEAAIEALEAAAKRLQKAIGRQVRMKFTPVLDFQLDPGVRGGERIDEILRTLHATEEE